MTRTDIDGFTTADVVNVFKLSKKSLSEKIYISLVEEYGMEPGAIRMELFSRCFEKVLKDYALVLKSGLIG